MNILYGLPLPIWDLIAQSAENCCAELNMQEMTYGWPTEMIVKAARRKARIIEVPVSYRSRLSGQSKVSGTIRGTLLAGLVYSRGYVSLCMENTLSI